MTARKPPLLLRSGHRYCLTCKRASDARRVPVR